MPPTATSSENSSVPGFLVLGASGGIGSALAIRLAARGLRVFLAGRNADRLTALSARLEAPFMVIDATRAEEVDRCFASASESLGSLYGVAHCVGSLLLKPAHLTTDAEWDATVATNLSSAFFVVRAAVRAMSAGAGGSIVLVSSAAAHTGLANHEAIAAAKAGVQGLALSAAATYAARGIRVNCVAPGLVRTPLTERIVRSEASLKASTSMHPLGRIGEPSDVASAIEWLLDPQQSWVTGQVLGIDGGLATLRSRNG